jgi:hypothetical protein
LKKNEKIMGYQTVNIYKGFQLARAWRSKTFLYGGEILPAHVTNYKTAMEFIDTYLIPKMTELGLYGGYWDPFTDDYSMNFPFNLRETMRNEIKKNWFYWKEK